MDTEKRVLIDYMKVKYYCKKNNWTITQLAEEVGVTRQTIRSWSIVPTCIANVWRLEDALEARTGELSITA